MVNLQNQKVNSTTDELLECFDLQGNPIERKSRQEIHTKPYVLSVLKLETL